MARMNKGMMLGLAAAVGGGIWMLMRGGRVQSPRDMGVDTGALTTDQLIAITLDKMGSAEHKAGVAKVLEDAVDRGYVDLTTMGADEIARGMQQAVEQQGHEYTQKLRTVDRFAESPEGWSAASTMTQPPQSAIDYAVAYVKGIDPDVRVLDVAAFAILANSGKLPAGTILAFVSDNVTRPMQTGGTRGFVLMSSAEVIKRLAEAGGAPGSGTAGMGDYVQMPYSGMGIGALYGVKGGSGATGLGF